jgi:hypothetical protein
VAPEDAERQGNGGAATAGSVTALDYIAVTAAIRSTVEAVLKHDAPMQVAVAAAAARILAGAPDIGPADHAERPLERLRRENATAMAQIEALAAAGRGRAACAIVARRMATNPADPLEVEMLAQRFRRLRRDQQKSERCSVAFTINV